MKPSRGTEFEPDDVRAIRRSLGKFQTEFALMIGVRVSTLQNWEQGRRVPEGPARALLRVAAENPRAGGHEPQAARQLISAVIASDGPHDRTAALLQIAVPARLENANQNVGRGRPLMIN